MKSSFQKLFLLLFLGLSALHAADFLMPDEAFKPYAKVEHGVIKAGVVIAKDIYLYEHAFKIELKNAQGIEIVKTDKPATKVLHGDKVYLSSPEYRLHLKKEQGISGVKKVDVLISYQGCSQAGLCYEPYKKKFTLDVDTDSFTVEAKKDTQTVQSETDSIAQSIASGNILLTLATFFGFGLLLAMTPCVFPMIPIISGLIISQGEGLTTKKAFFLSVVYVLAMAVAYTIAGVLAGLFGANLQAALQTPWVVYSFALIFVFLAFSMFGFYELKLPDALVNKVSASNNSRSGVMGVAIMGFLSALIVGPCVAAPLAGALVYIGQTGDAFLGGMALFSMSIGMGVPLIVVGVSAGKFMPKPGGWMTMVTAIFGVMMLGVAIWMLSKVVNGGIIAGLYGMLGLGFALYLGVFEREGHIFKRSVSLIIFLYSLALFLGFLAGKPSMTQPLAFLVSHGSSATTQSEQKELSFQVIHSIDELDGVMAKNKGKKIMLDFAADWCTACKELEEVTFADAKVQKALSEYVLIRADLTANGAEEKALSKKYGVFGPPVVIFFDAAHQEHKSNTIVGFVKPEKFLQHLL